MKKKKISAATKKQIVLEYKNGVSAVKLTKKYHLSDKRRIYSYVKQYDDGNVNFEEKRGKATGSGQGRPRAIKPIEDMTKDEYIEYLEMKLDILKLLAEMEAQDINGK